VTTQSWSQFPQLADARRPPVALGHTCYGSGLGTCVSEVKSQGPNAMHVLGRGLAEAVDQGFSRACHSRCHDTITTKQRHNLVRSSVDKRPSTILPEARKCWDELSRPKSGRRIGRPRLGEPEGRDSITRRASNHVSGRSRPGDPKFTGELDEYNREPRRG
jgi:hypothetical protein